MDLKMSPCTDLCHAVNSRILKKQCKFNYIIMYRTVQQNLITQETYHTKWSGENKTSIILRSWLILDVAQWRPVVTFHNIGNKPPTYTQ